MPLNSAILKALLSSLGIVLRRMLALESAIDAVNGLRGNGQNVALTALRRTFARDIAIIADKLRTNGDPLSKEFRSTLASARQLAQDNIDATSGVIDEGTVGRCEPSQYTPPGVPFAATQRTPFFAANDDLQRDVITHEFFHLLGLADVKTINSTADALNDANTVAQVVAYMHDRRRTRDSSDFSQPPVAYPSP